MMFVLFTPGGLTADASESAYQAFNRRVLLQEGGAADIGDVALELGLGTVSGALDLEVGVGSDTVTVNLERIEDNDKAVRRVGEAAYSESVDDDGSFTVEDVQVGFLYAHHHRTWGVQQQRRGRLFGSGASVAAFRASGGAEF